MAAASVFTLNQIRLASRKKLLRLCTDKCKVNRPNVQQQNYNNYAYGTRSDTQCRKELVDQCRSAQWRIARPLAARCGCRIFRPSVFGDRPTGVPIQPYCLHFFALHSFLNTGP